VEDGPEHRAHAEHDERVPFRHEGQRAVLDEGERGRHGQQHRSCWKDSGE
jgi:hypothetical protein